MHRRPFTALIAIASICAAPLGVLKGLRRQKALDAAKAMRNTVRIAKAAGVKIALGIDAGVGVGSLTAGKWADIVAVPGDPLKDIKNMERALFVMKGGAIYKTPAVALHP